MREFIRKEKKAFSTFDADGKRLITVNILYSMVFPFIIIFSTAFVNRATGDQVIVIVNSFGFGVGLILGNLTNGLLLRRNADIRILFSAGLFLSMASTFMMMMWVDHTIGYYIFFYGLMAGYGNGFYWANRQFISYLVTNESNRNFFASIDYFFITFFNAFIPFLFGTLVIILGRKTGWYNEIQAYRGFAGFMLLLMMYTVLLVMKSSFKSPKLKKFIYVKYNRHWNLHRILITSIGFVQSGFMFFIPLLILNVAGDETVLGKIEVAIALISIAVVYILGRVTNKKHRARMMLFGALFIIIGGMFVAFTINNDEMIINIMKVSFLGVIIMKIFQVSAEPVINVSFAATNLSDIENASRSQSRDSYAYVFDNDIFMNLGRIGGGVLFIILSNLISPIGALKYIFIILGALQFGSAYLVKKLNRVEVKEQSAPITDLKNDARIISNAGEIPDPTAAFNKPL